MRRKESPDLMMVTLEARDFYPKINGEKKSKILGTLNTVKMH